MEQVIQLCNNNKKKTQGIDYTCSRSSFSVRRHVLRTSRPGALLPCLQSCLAVFNSGLPTRDFPECSHFFNVNNT